MKLNLVGLPFPLGCVNFWKCAGVRERRTVHNNNNTLFPGSQSTFFLEGDSCSHSKTPDSLTFCFDRFNNSQAPAVINKHQKWLHWHSFSPFLLLQYIRLIILMKFKDYNIGPSAMLGETPAQHSWAVVFKSLIYFTGNLSFSAVSPLPQTWCSSITPFSSSISPAPYSFPMS